MCVDHRRPIETSIIIWIFLVARAVVLRDLRVREQFKDMSDEEKCMLGTEPVFRIERKRNKNHLVSEYHTIHGLVQEEEDGGASRKGGKHGRGGHVTNRRGVRSIFIQVSLLIFITSFGKDCYNRCREIIDRLCVLVQPNTRGSCSGRIERFYAFERPVVKWCEECVGWLGGW